MEGWEGATLGWDGSVSRAKDDKTQKDQPIRHTTAEWLPVIGTPYREHRAHS